MWWCCDDEDPPNCFGCPGETVPNLLGFSITGLSWLAPTRATCTEGPFNASFQTGTGPIGIYSVSTDHVFISKDIADLNGSHSALKHVGNPLCIWYWDDLTALPNKYYAGTGYIGLSNCNAAVVELATYSISHPLPSSGFSPPLTFSTITDSDCGTTDPCGGQWICATASYGVRVEIAVEILRETSSGVFVSDNSAGTPHWHAKLIFNVVRSAVNVDPARVGDFDPSYGTGIHLPSPFARHPTIGLTGAATDSSDTSDGASSCPPYRQQGVGGVFADYIAEVDCDNDFDSGATLNLATSINGFDASTRRTGWDITAPSTMTVSP